MQEQTLEKTAKDYADIIKTNMPDKLEPIHKSVDDILSRLEEYQTIIYVAQQEQSSATSTLMSVLEKKDELNVLFDRIDAIQSLIDHVKCNLETVEENVDKAEEAMGYTENTATSKVANIFTPLFIGKKSGEKKSPSEPMKFFSTSDYFQTS